MELITLTAKRINETRGAYKDYYRTDFFKPDGSHFATIPATARQPKKNMKTIVINCFRYAIKWELNMLIILLFPVLSFAQSVKIQLKKQIAPAVLIFLAGAADGLNQKISYQYKDFKKHFPGANDQYWYPPMSFANKYKDGDKTKGERFWGSSGALVFLTDGYHFTRFLDRLFTAGAFSVKIFLWDKEKWWKYILHGVGFWATNRLGFYTAYSVILK